MTDEQITIERRQHLNALRESKAFQFFLEQCVKPKADKAQASLEDVKTGKDERETAAYLAKQAKEIMGWVENEWLSVEPPEPVG